MNAFGVTDLVVRYGRLTAVCGVSFTVPPGRIVSLIGGDGAGKTTTLRALAGVVAPAAGQVRSPGKAGIGYVPAGPGVYMDLTIEENLAFSGHAYGVPAAVLDRRIGALLAATALSPARRRLAGALSGGMRRKLALAMALIHEPRLLILDEATTGVDPVSRAELWRMIAGAAARGAAVVFATTYIEEAERAFHVVALERGRVLLKGSPEGIVASIPGRIREVRERPQGGIAYRRGQGFRLWDPKSGDEGIRPDLEDALVIAALKARERAA